MKTAALKEKRQGSKKMARTETSWVAIIGNPNSGKTAVFNNLTGSRYKVGNYPGVTVEKKSGWLRGHPVEVHDLPGTYSLNARSQDERVAVDLIQSWRDPRERPRAVVIVLDSTNLTRNLYLTLQVLEFGIPTIVVLNMMDELRKRGLTVNAGLLRERLQAHAVIPASAKTGEGMAAIVEAILAVPAKPLPRPMAPKLEIADYLLDPLQELTALLATQRNRLLLDPQVEALRLVTEKNYIDYLVPYLEIEEIEAIGETAARARQQYVLQRMSYMSLESTGRYNFIDKYLAEACADDTISKVTFSERIDSVISHTVGGPLILMLILAFIFNTIFSWAEYPMGWIEAGIGWLSLQATTLLPQGIIQSLIVDGIIAGVGNVIVFLPQIVLLIFFISLLEDSGYITRMAFILDRIMKKWGLHGKAVLPMLSGFACAIPAIMASRTIENWRDRLITILLIPLMSCSARLPVYILLISAFIPQQTIFGFIQLQALVLMGMYFLGFFSAVAIAFLIKRFVPARTVSHFVMELPPYRMPMLRSIWWKVYDSGKLFLINAGSIILAISVILWFLASYPKPAETENLNAKEAIAQSYAGQIGHLMEPVIAPLGFDWKVGIGLVASFAAREVLVSTFATIYNIEAGDDAEVVPLIEAMRNDRRPDGTPVYNILSAISLMVFFVFSAQCMATFAIVKRETNSWRWPLVMMLYMTTLAYIASLIVYQGGKLLGWG
ncbi:MAG: ferrous iron transport protein B [Calditrichaeota bacterium]|nr:ferrous iron transport protein B [Calditrichota bacterium]MCB0304931.1 ferrous iron transport protein B [Calditrichota bacterium]